MPIPIQPEEEDVTEVFGNCLENCVFCDTGTRFWHVDSNRTVCPQCSTKYDVCDIKYAKYAY